jgi:nitric oxide reductase NorD protein
MALLLLVDVSGSTDAWVGAGCRVVDVAREALLCVCIALASLGEPFAVQSFSGEGPHGVRVRELKRFGEHYRPAVALRIAGLAPEGYTRTGAALRHAAAALREVPAERRLLLLLSDGKPNDVDVYEGPYGAEDTRRAVLEARLAGIAPFCLAIDRHEALQLPRLFGRGRYALLPRTELLPALLLTWIHRLVH